MSLPIHVEAYSGYRANERPLAFSLDIAIGENGVTNVMTSLKSRKAMQGSALLRFGAAVALATGGFVAFAVTVHRPESGARSL